MMTTGGMRLAALGIIAAGVLAVGGCAVTPEPIDKAELSAIVTADRASIGADQDPITGPLTKYEAMARVVAYNLDNRTRMMEEALANAQVDLAQYDMLPTLAAEAGFTSRDNVEASSSESVQTQAQSLVPSTSTNRNRVTADAKLSWNILDFGVSYFQAKQQADRYLIAQGNRRKLMLRLLQQARTAFWRAAAAQKLKPEVEKQLASAKAALDDVDRAQAEQLRPRLESLQMKRTLLEVVGQLEALNQQLASSEIELKALINVFPRTQIALSIPDKPAQLPPLAVNTDDMELLALENSSDVTEALYQLRVEQGESKKALLRLLPGLEFYDSINFDSNTFLVNNMWQEAGSRVTWNLFRLLTIQSSLDLAEARQNLAETRRKAMDMAVISRLHLALWRYQDNLHQSERADRIDAVERGISKSSTAAETADSGTAIERIRNEATALRAKMRSFESYANAQDSLGSVFVSLGLDPVPDDYRSRPVKDLADMLRHQFTQWEEGHFPVFIPPAVPQAELGPRRGGARIPAGVMSRLTALAVALAMLAVPSAFAANSAQPQIRAQLKAKRSAVLASGMAGEIDRMPVREGDHVAEGALIAAIDCVGQAASKRVAEAKLVAAQAKERSHKRLAELKQSSVLEVEVAHADAVMAAAELAVINATLRKCEVHAPFPGVVVTQPARPNQYIREGEPLVELVDVDGLEVEMVLPSRWLEWLKPGSAFTMTVDELHRTIPASVDRIGGRVDPVSQTVRVLGRIEGRQTDLLPGMSGTVAFPDQPK